MFISHPADFQTCSYQGRAVRLHYSLLQLSVHAEAEDKHPELDRSNVLMMALKHI